MTLMATDTGGTTFDPVPQGTHLAICNMIVDLGDQDTEWQGVHTTKRQIYVRWETPHERIEWDDDQGHHEGPRVIGKTYTLSLSEKANLRKDLEAWRGRAFTPDELKGFDVLTILGQPCQISITHREKEQKVYANVTGVAGVPKGITVPSCENTLIAYTKDEPTQFDQLPEWLQKRVGEQVDQSQPPAHLDEAPPADMPADFGSEVPF